jgi:serine/threonine protein kinase
MSFNPPLTPDEVEEAFKGQFSGLTSLSTGGQGTVFRALLKRTPADSVDVALKIYHLNQVQERTRREIAALRRLASPHIVALIDEGVIALRNLECRFIATAYIAGQSLRETLKVEPLQLDDGAHLGISLARAIELIWSYRIVHRDIKPENVMTAADHIFVLIDLGIARHLELSTLTAAGTTWGTVGYMSPEQAMARKQLSCKTDVFSTGIVLQEALLGRHPTGGRQDALLFGGPPTASVIPTLPRGFCDLIDRMVSKEPHRRPTPGDIVEGLGSLTTGGLH